MIGCLARPSSPSSRAKSAEPKRAASGARGRSRRSSIRRKPACASAGNRLVFETQSRERQAAEQARDFFLVLLTQDHRPAPLFTEPLLTEPRQGPGGFRRRRERGTCGKALRGETAFDVGKQCFFAAEEMRGARHIEHHAIGRIERGERRESAAPVRNVGERLRFACGIGRHADERRQHGARIGEHHAGLEA